jgi:hypothetical protein
MPRITITVDKSTLDAIDDFAGYVGKSRSVVCASVFEMVVPMLGYLKTTYDFALKGDAEGMGQMLASLDDLLSKNKDEFESLKADISGVADGVNPRSCNNGGQVSPTDLQNPTQPVVFLEKSPLDTPPEDQGGKNA